jgi:hypothetical protein
MATFGNYGQYLRNGTARRLLAENDILISTINEDVEFIKEESMDLSGNIDPNDISQNTADISTNTSAINSIITDVSNNKIGIAGNTSTITPILSDVSNNTFNISVNTANVASSSANVTTNENAITDNSNNIASSVSDVSVNKIDISNNMDAITSIIADVSVNILDISSVTFDVSTNKINIAANDTDISFIVTNVPGNTADISQNRTDISTNIVDISDNEDRIIALEATYGKQYLFAHNSTGMLFDMSNTVYDISFDVINRADAAYVTTNLGISGEFEMAQAGLYLIKFQVSCFRSISDPTERYVTITMRDGSGNAVPGGLMNFVIANNTQYSSGGISVLLDLSGGEKFNYTWEQTLDIDSEIVANTCRLLVEKIS